MHSNTTHNDVDTLKIVVDNVTKRWYGTFRTERFEHIFRGMFMCIDDGDIVCKWTPPPMLKVNNKIRNVVRFNLRQKTMFMFIPPVLGAVSWLYKHHHTKRYQRTFVWYK